MVNKIREYKITWSVRQQKGNIRLVLVNGYTDTIELDSVQELSALAELLRSSNDLGFDNVAKTLCIEGRCPTGA